MNLTKEITLEYVQAGNQVYWFNTERYELRRVIRTTATQIVLAHDIRYRRSDGKPVGKDVLFVGQIRSVSSEEITRIEEEESRKQLESILRKKDWSKVSVEAMERILIILAKDKVEQKQQ